MKLHANDPRRARTRTRLFLELLETGPCWLVGLVAAYGFNEGTGTNHGGRTPRHRERRAPSRHATWTPDGSRQTPCVTTGQQLVTVAATPTPRRPERA